MVPGRCLTPPFAVLVQITKLSSSSPCQRQGLTSTSWWHRLSQRRMCKSWGHFQLLLGFFERPLPQEFPEFLLQTQLETWWFCRKHPRIVPGDCLAFLTSKMLLFTLKILGFLCLTGRSDTEIILHLHAAPEVLCRFTFWHPKHPTAGIGFRG